MREVAKVSTRDPVKATPPVVGEDIISDPREAVIVVSGLPRSGTSMIMQMLAAGGLPVLRDDQAQADEDNPLGYFEYEAVKRLHENTMWLKNIRGQAVKVVAPLLQYLPRDQDYLIVFIERDVEEVLSSQARMLTRRGDKLDDSSARKDRLRETYTRQIKLLKTTLLQRPRTRCLFLNHVEVMNDPHVAAERLNRFLGGQLVTAAMSAAVIPSLHRHRKSVKL